MSNVQEPETKGRFSGLRSNLRGYFGRSSSNAPPRVARATTLQAKARNAPVTEVLADLREPSGAVDVDQNFVIDLDIAGELQAVKKTHEVGAFGKKLDTHIGTRDKHYAEVLEKVKEFFDACKTAAADVKQLLALGDETRQALSNFAEGLSEKDRKREELDPSRSAKLTRCNELRDAIATAMADIRQKAEASRIEAFNLLVERAANDPGRLSKAEAKQFLDMAAEARQLSPEANRMLLEKFPALIERCEHSDIDRVINKIVDERLANRNPPDAAFVERLCDELLSSEIAAARNHWETFMRSNTSASKLVGRYVRTSPNGKAALGALCNGAHGRIQAAGKKEVDPVKIEPPDPVAVQQAVAEHKQMARQMIDEMTQVQLPPEITKVAYVMYQEVMDTIGDPQEARMKALNLIFLRLVNPHLVSPEGTDPNAPRLDTKQRRTAVIQSKILQNMVNGVRFGEKEEYMAPFNELIVTDADQPSPEVVRLLQMVDNAIIAGQQLIGAERNQRKQRQRDFEAAKQMKLEQALGDARMVGGFRAFCQRSLATENLNFLLEYRNEISQDPGRYGAAAYDKYMKVGADEALNADHLQPDFEEIARRPVAARDWSQAPWRDVYEHIREMTENDIYARFKASDEFNSLFA